MALYLIVEFRIYFFDWRKLNIDDFNLKTTYYTFDATSYASQMAYMMFETLRASPSK